MMNYLARTITSALAALLISWLVNASCIAQHPVSLFDQQPIKISNPEPNVTLIDFGRVAFGNLQLKPPSDAKETITVHFGEKSKDGRIDRDPPGTVRYNSATVDLTGGKPIIAAPPVDKRHVPKKCPPAIHTPDEWGVILPFRWVEIEGWPGELKADQIVRRAAFATDWDDDAANFKSSDEMLDQVWELCRYSIKATTFAGVYVDGDRERIPYEADAYLNQLSHYSVDHDIQIARRTFDRLMKYPTWPTEWAPHMVFMAHADWMHTGDTDWLAERYESLKTKTLFDRVGEDGLVRSNAKQIKRDDIVDWPKTERDDFVFTEVNTVVNAFYLAAMNQMADLARAIGKDTEADQFEERVTQALPKFHNRLFDSKRGIYRDGIGTDHASYHASLFPLAFGLVPTEHRKGVVDWLSSRDMRCSVYAAQYLLEGLFQNGGEQKALELFTAADDRSWRHMVESGTTISWEAWDMKYKPNQDWNHAWGAAPANLLPRFVLGAQPLEPGWKHVLIRPCPGTLKHAKGKIPTPISPILIDWNNESGFRMSLALPDNVTAKVELPAAEGSTGVTINGKPVDAKRVGSRWVLTETVTGPVEIKVVKD